ncbi:MAG: hypothetical protein K0U59_03245 [Gammaproteobacteria bacterium]|nr:hypothetical protein [Gammaproteobacteria bacterium]
MTLRLKQSLKVAQVVIRTNGKKYLVPNKLISPKELKSLFLKRTGQEIRVTEVANGKSGINRKTGQQERIEAEHTMRMDVG